MPLLLCDLDDTLIDRSGAFARWTDAFMARHRIEPRHRDWILARDAHGHADRAAFFIALRAHLGLEPTVDELLAEFAATWPWPVEPPPAETVAALQRLRRSGWRIGVVTNGPPTQDLKLDLSGIRPLIDGCCVSSLVGVHKPHPAIFRLAARRCGADLAHAWMVGDSDADVAGALGVGIPSVWLRRGRRWTEAAYRPTLEADSFAEAAALVLAT